MISESEEADVNPLSSVVHDTLSVSPPPGVCGLVSHDELSPSSILVSGISSSSIEETAIRGLLTNERGVAKLLMSLRGDRDESCACLKLSVMLTSFLGDL